MFLYNSTPRTREEVTDELQRSENFGKACSGLWREGVIKTAFLGRPVVIASRQQSLASAPVAHAAPSQPLLAESP